MADILIRGMEMPKNGEHATITVYWDGVWCIHCDNEPHGKAVLLPAGYGRLVDADALIRDKSCEVNLWCDYEYQDHSVVFKEDIKNAPTIVQAEVGTDDGPAGGSIGRGNDTNRQNLYCMN